MKFNRAKYQFRLQNMSEQGTYEHINQLYEFNGGLKQNTQKYLISKTKYLDKILLISLSPE